MFITNQHQPNREKETARVTDKKEWCLDITYLFYYDCGMAIADCEDDRIEVLYYPKLHEPQTDSDADWEQYEFEKEQFKERAKTDLEASIERYLKAL